MDGLVGTNAPQELGSVDRKMAELGNTIAEHQPEVQRELQGLEQVVNQLQESLTSLAERLQPIINERPIENSDAEKAPEASTSLGGAVRSQTDRVRNAVLAVRTITQSVEV